jgi:hypothetical protein
VGLNLQKYLEDNSAGTPAEGPEPATPAGVLALQSEVRRGFTEQLRAQNERMEKTCPSVFTLVPSKGFRQLDTWIEYATQKEELELALYCEHESGWHATSHSLYRFSPEQEWFDLVKTHWNQFVKVSKRVGPLASLIGKAAGVPWAELVAGGIEKVPELAREPANALASTLGEKAKPELIDIDTRYLLKQLIDHLDSLRSDIEPKNGGLHRYLVDDGRLLWLCPDHLKLYRKRD